jgi:putative nucleotidyltransferase with HDIG domain
MHAHIKQRIESIISNLNQLPSIPDVASKVLTMATDPDVSFKKVAEEIAKDQAITTNILKLCNSAYFSKGKEITSIDRALVTLGLKEVKDVVIVAATKAILNKTIIGYDLAKGELWKHGLAVGIMSKKIARQKNRKDIADIVFTGGIIHDIGKTVLAIYVQNTYKDILDTVEKNSIPFQQAEKEIMGYDHQEIGERVLTKWKFPEVLKAIVQFHHQPDRAPDEFKPYTSIVHIANTICLMAGIGIGSDGLYHELNDAAINTIKLSDQDLETFYAEIPEMMNQAKELI